MAMARCGFRHSVGCWIIEGKNFLFKIINSIQLKIIIWLAIVFCRIRRNTACKDSRREIPEVEGSRTVCSLDNQRERKFQA